MDFRVYLGSLMLLISIASIILLVKFYHSPSKDEQKAPKNDHKAPKNDSSSKHELKTYIIYTGHKFKDEATSVAIYHHLLEQVVPRNARRPILNYYWRSFSGFVANLTDDEAAKMAGLDGVVSVFPNRKLELLNRRP
ncbi:hypothetical protein P8452_44188 [Trifolium repens]|nr:hypothetical protein P8452_44188 [Trifolium repens]